VSSIGIIEFLENGIPPQIYERNKEIIISILR
jgi:hypothetical protein